MGSLTTVDTLVQAMDHIIEAVEEQPAATTSHIGRVAHLDVETTKRLVYDSTMLVLEELAEMKEERRGTVDVWGAVRNQIDDIQGYQAEDRQTIMAGWRPRSNYNSLIYSLKKGHPSLSICMCRGNFGQV